MSLALRNLAQDKTRLALSVAGIALAVMLILFLNGFLAGVYSRASAYLRNAPGSVVVLPEGVDSTLSSGVLLPPGLVENVTGAEGVARATPVIALPAIPELHGRKEVLLVTGYDPALGGGPWSLAAGRQPGADDELVLDRLVAGRHGVGLGDSIEIAGRAFTVVGLSNETSSLVGVYVFARKSAVESLLIAPGTASMLLVTPAPGVSSEDLREQLDGLPGADALLKRTVIANNERVLGRVFDQPLLLMIGIAFVVGTLVVGLVIYTATVERQREYGVLKAVGAPNGVLYRVVVVQALVAAAAGAVLGVGLAFVMGRLVMALRPQFLVTIGLRPILLALAAGLVMALVAALAPARSVARLAPADVFRR